MEQNTQPSLNVSDLQLVTELIDLCSQRGAFRAEELAAVGALYNRLKEFLNTVQPSDEADPAAAESVEVSNND
jgi:hypothetical protein